jgi:hypothetical protein
LFKAKIAPSQSATWFFIKSYRKIVIILFCIRHGHVCSIIEYHHQVYCSHDLPAVIVDTSRRAIQLLLGPYANFQMILTHYLSLDLFNILFTRYLYCNLSYIYVEHRQHIRFWINFVFKLTYILTCVHGWPIYGQLVSIFHKKNILLFCFKNRIVYILSHKFLVIVYFNYSN